MDFFFKNSYVDLTPVLDQLPSAGSDIASPSQSLTIAIAISGSNKSKNVLQWALKAFGSERNVLFKLIHIHPIIDSLTTPSGNRISISENEAVTYRQQVLREKEETLLKHFKKMCERKKVGVEVVVLESNNIALAITREVNHNLISRLVIGRSAAFSSNYDIAAKISASVSTLCTVYVVSKKVHILSKEKLSSDTEKSETVCERTDSSGCSSTSDEMSNALKSNSYAMSNKRVPSSADSDESRRKMSWDAADELSKRRSSQETSRSVSWNPRFRDFEDRKDAMSSVSSNNRDYLYITQGGDYFTDNQDMLKEVTMLRAELRHAKELYQVALVETSDDSCKVNELINLEEMTLKEPETKELEEKESKVGEGSSHVTHKMQYQEFTWEDIIAATSSFSEDMKIGVGANGTVYKCNLHHTIAAVKVLHSAEASMSKQFDQELEILSKIRHPHLVLLLGACPERGALVYEYMKNGSLEDRLFQVNNSQPIPWFIRFRIAWEVASALVFLHKSKPRPIIHRDLKPANILLDHNFVSKVGDVGLSTMIQSDTSTSKSTVYKQTSPVGTFCYIDPEYQRTGMVSPKSDVYAFGMILLQLLTGQPAIALTYTVETAMENNDDGELLQILDQKAGKWPIEETRQLASLALKCTEICARDRPDLNDKILPVLERLKNVADKARISPPRQQPPPSHFLCPLLKDVMKEPCVAADGYTYDREAIEEWMEGNSTSPVTSLPLRNMNLLPDHTLRAAIADWRRTNQ